MRWKKTFLTCFLTSLLFITNAQNGNFKWVKQMVQGGSQDEGISVATDASGNAYTTGRFTGTVDFDPGPSTYNLVANGYSGMFVSKLDSGGHFVWAKQMGGNGNLDGAFGYSIALDLSGNIYTTGFLTGSVDFDPGPGAFILSSDDPNSFYQNSFVAKLDAAGNFLWAKVLPGGADVGGGQSIATDAAGNVYASGIFQYTGDFDPGPGIFNLDGGVINIFITKLDASGNFIWARAPEKVSPGNVLDLVHICVDAGGNVYCTGDFQGPTDFDPGAGVFSLNSVNNTSDIFVWKLTTNGNFIWAKQFGGPGQEFGFSIAVDALGNVFSTGYFGNTVDFDPGPATYNLTQIGRNNMYVSKLDPDGNFIYAKQMGGTGASYGSSIALDVFANVYTTGQFDNTIDFDPGPGIFNLIATGGKMFVSKLSADGNFIWAKQMEGMGGGAESYGASVVVDALENVYTTGFFGGSIDFDPGTDVYGVNSTIGHDIFVHKIGPLCTNKIYTSLTVSDCKGYTVNGHTYKTTGIYKDTVVTIYGCDSIITLNLTIKPQIISTISQSICFGKVYNGHNTTGTYVDTLISANGCDSVVTLNLTIGPKIVSTISQSVCFGQSYNGHSSSGTYADTLKGANGCDSIVALNLTIRPKIVSTISQSICAGQSYNGHSTSGTYIDTLTAANGCDSIRTLNLLVAQKITSTVAQSICAGQSYNGHSTSGIYIDTLKAVGACDSIITLDLTIKPKIVSIVSQSVCFGQSYNGHGTSGIYSDTLKAANGCDSIVTLNLIIKPKIISIISQTVCFGQSYNGHNSSGTYVDTLKGANGCDSVVTLNLTIKPKITSAISQSLCFGQSYHGHNTSGTYADTLKGANGCDSIVTVNLIIKPKITFAISQSVCFGQSYKGHSTSGIYVDTLAGANGCDSIVTLNLTIKPKIISTISQSICFGQFYNGYSTTGVYVDTLMSASGCDSIRILQLKVLKNPLPDLGADRELCSGDSLQLDPGKFNTYTWQDGSQLNHFTVKKPGSYFVVVTDNCGTARDEIVIKEKVCDIYFPSAFTPNSDGSNDVFKIIGGYNLSDYHLAIYNRWGKLVFQTNDPSKGWTGLFNGQLQQTGIYIWQCRFNRSGINTYKKGTVVLVK